MRKCQRLLLGFVSIFCLALPIQVHAQDLRKPLDIIVRDGTGAPMEDVDLIIYAGPPYYEVEKGATDASGTFGTELIYGSYILSFSGKWEDFLFINSRYQNGGSLTNDNIGGFGFYVSPDETVEELPLTFVIGQDDAGLLVPLYDLSRNSLELPEPLTYTNLKTHEVHLDEDAVFPVTMSPLVKIAGEAETEREASLEVQLQDRHDRTEQSLNKPVSLDNLIWVGFFVLAAIFSALVISIRLEIRSGKRE